MSELKEKISREQAEKEVNAWLDKKKVFQETRDRYKDHIEILIEAICNGVLVIDTSSFEITHELLFPLTANEDENVRDPKDLRTLTYRARINDNLVKPHLRGIKGDDADGRLNALLAALTDSSHGIINKIDSADKRIATAIGVFFT